LEVFSISQQFAISVECAAIVQKHKDTLKTNTQTTYTNTPTYHNPQACMKRALTQKPSKMRYNIKTNKHPKNWYNKHKPQAQNENMQQQT